ncbi:KAT8 regulatory NSL complex subunit 1-like protein isoform X3 [Hippoglossus hippoglossus]|uniref:KAT8 regulatory NSL complex subunit 1-like protein isoform X3 n=1 Tax=Hippoglossus hippoglossus TaxID=8267 RepID=UPI00148CB9A2|nr:KAT8 regulatory NSL complex subunit 1-like protein isoform X3 [Hippoglossus hippoglossus]
MAPALTKILKDGHGIHLSSPLSSVRGDSNGRAMHRTELDPHMRPTEDGDAQMWLNLSFCPSLDPCLPARPLKVLANPVLPPCLEASASQWESVVLSSPASLLGFLSFNEDPRDSHQVVSVLPGVPDMFLGPVPEHNSQEACLLHGRGAAHECGPDGGDVHRSPFTLTSVSQSDFFGEIKSQDWAPFSPPPPTLTQERAARVDYAPLASEQSCSGSLNFDQLVPRAVLEEAMKEQLSRQEELQGQAWRLQKRLQALLGEHALRHCNQQLEGLKQHIHLGDVLNDSLDSSHLGIVPPQVGGKPFLSSLESSTASSSFTEHRELSRSSQAVLRGLQEALDSEATASSSSDDEVEEEKNVSKTTTSRVSSSSRCARRWLEERVELGSRWSWLQLRLSELEGRIQQLVELHKHIRSSKGGVVLAASQPLTDRQIQQTLLKEVEGLCCTASDADTEPCSPTHLLHSIERQSAQLSQIVRSLMPPLSFSPLSKQARTCKDKRSFTSGQREDDAFLPGGSKRQRLATTRRYKADAWVCARTRPLVSYHKPKLFTFNTHNSSSSQEPWKSMSTLSSSLSSSSYSCCSSPAVMCSDADCSSSSSALTSRRKSSRAHCAMSLSFGTPQAHPPQRALAREEWSQRTLVDDAQSPTPVHFKRRTSTPLHNSHKYKQHARHLKSRVMGLSPIRMTGSAQGRHRRANQKERKRRHSHRLEEDYKDVLYRSCEPEGSSDDVLEESYTQFPRKQDSQGSVRKRQGESVYNINNIVIPMSLTKVEKLQYKDILTPRWRLLSSQSTREKETERKEDSEEAQVEELSDEAFAQRYVALEKKEKLRWSSWGKRKCFRHLTRSGSRLSGGGGGVFTSGEESSVEWSGAQLETDEQPSLEEWLPQTPWERRVFPLDEDEDEALLSDSLVCSDSGYDPHQRTPTPSSPQHDPQVLHCPLVNKAAALHLKAAEGAVP